MRLLVVTDKIIYKCQDVYFSSGGFPYQLNAFKQEFTHIDLLAPVIEIKDKHHNFESKLLVSNVYAVNPLNKTKYIYSSIKRSFNLNVNQYDYIQLRLPSKNSIIFFACNFNCKKYFSIIGGHPYKSIIDGLGRKSPKIFKKFVAHVNLLFTKLIMSNSKVFVTGSELSREFTSYNPVEMISTSISSKEITLDKQKCSLCDLIFIGRFTKEKNIKLILEALSYLRNEKSINLKLVLIGDGPERKEIEEYIKNHELTDQVNIVGQINDRQKLLQYLRESKIFILSSLTEGTPKVIVEAMSQGTPVVSSDVGGIKGLITHLENGVLFESNSVKGLSEGIVTLLEDEKLYKKIRNNGYLFVSENTLEKYIEKLIHNLMK